LEEDTMPATAHNPRPTGILGIHSVNHVCLAVPDLAKAQQFYGAFGLQTRAGGNSLGLYTYGQPHRWVHLIEGHRKLLRYISLGAYADDMPRFAQHLKQQGIEQLEPPAGSDGEGVWFHSPQGHLFELRTAEKSSPSEKSYFGLELPASPTRGTFRRSEAPIVRPRRLSHVALYTPDVNGSIHFLSRVLGMRLSDRSLDIVAFMHGVHGSDHHMMALVQSPAPGFHHVSWDVGTVQDVGLGAMQMAASGYAAGWGVGRHVLGSNYFYYVRDPWGSFSEYSAAMDYIPRGMDWQSTDSPPEDSMFLWGPPPPRDFITNFEAE
jgi:catechol 2,3-dioxygenase-like lactoylglutathione lyase family enzyme